MCALQDFLESEGIEVNPSESCPVDPYVTKRQTSAALKTYKSPTDFDKLKQFIDMDRKVLRFFAIWDDRDNMFGELRKFIIHVSTYSQSKWLYWLNWYLLGITHMRIM